MSIFNWLRRKPKYAVWIDRTSDGRYLSRIVDGKDAERCMKDEASPRTYFVTPIQDRCATPVGAWADALDALKDIEAGNFHLAECYVEKEGGGVFNPKYDPS